MLFILTIIVLDKKKRVNIVIDCICINKMKKPISKSWEFLL